MAAEISEFQDDTNSVPIASAVPIGALELFAEVLSQSEQDPAAGDGFYNRLCEAVCRLARLRRAVIFRYEPESRQVRAAGAHGMDLGGFEGVNVSLDTARFAADAMRRDEVVEVAGDIRDHLPPEYSKFLTEPVRIVCAPMLAAGRGVGVIIAERGLEEPPLEPSERHLLWTLGKAAALASVARSVATQAETSRQLRQRIDLAREVHEGVIQRLFGVSMVLDGEGELPADVRARCASETQAALSELRDAMQRPLGRASRGTRLSFAEALGRHAADNPELALEITGVDRVPEQLEPLAQSILREAVRNTVKHAKASTVTVTTELSDGAFVLEVINDGIKGAQRRHPGMGLRLAAFEALQSGGIVEFGPRDSDHWQVRLVVPYGD